MRDMHYLDDTTDDDEMFDAADGGDEDDEEESGEDLGDVADDLDELIDRAQSAGASATVRRALEAASASLRHEARTGRPTTARQLSDALALLLAETGGAGVYPDRDAAGNPRSQKASVEARVQRQIQAQLAARQRQKARQQELQTGAPDLTPMADRLAQQRYGRSIDDLARDPAHQITTMQLYREAELTYKKRQGLG